MKTLCIWGETRRDVLDGYAFIANRTDAPQRVTWRLASSFNGSPVGAVCYAPKHPEIEDAYDEVMAKADNSKGVEDNDADYEDES